MTPFTLVNQKKQTKQQHKHDTVELWMTDDAAALNQVSQLSDPLLL